MFYSRQAKPFAHLDPDTNNFAKVYHIFFSFLTLAPHNDIAMQKLGNYITGKWIEGDGDGQLLYNAVTGNAITSASTKGLDFEAILNYARQKGNPALRKMTFQERGRMLRALAIHLLEKKEQFYTISYQSGATRIDSWIDIEGGIGNLFSNASLRRKLPDEPFCLDGDSINLSKQNTWTANTLFLGN